jgi:hypothetical protein
VAAPVLAKDLKLDFRSLRPFLRRAGTAVLSIPVIGKGQTLFVRKEIARSLAAATSHSSGQPLVPTHVDLALRDVGLCHEL